MTKNEYELNYWNNQRDIDMSDRYLKIKSLWGIDTLSGDILEIGAGPRNGLLPLFEGNKTSLDPLNSDYIKQGLLAPRSDIEYITGSIENTTLNKKYDYVLCANSLDHGESDFSSMNIIKDLLKPRGKFYLLVHLRTREQLNEGHNRFMDLKEYENNLNGFNEIFRKIYEKDPTGDGDYRTLVSCLERKDCVDTQ
jgi:SAM-dependent methyltransferase